jgi:hypothetical protein
LDRFGWTLLTKNLLKGPSSQPGTVLVTGARAPVALHLARLLASGGHKVVLGDTLKAPLGRQTRFANYVRLPAPRTDPEGYAQALNDVATREGVTLIIPTCEEVFHLGLAVRSGRLNVPVFAPKIDLLAEVHNKLTFIQLCERLGLAVPETLLLTNRAALDSLLPRARDIVFKPAWSRFASRVLIRPDASELKRIVPTIDAPWVAQEALSGTEISVYAVAVEGRLAALSLYRSRYRAGKGAGIWLEPVTDAAARTFVSRFVEGTGWTGQISFDLMRLADGRILPLECNPRATSGLHFFRDAPSFVQALAQGGEVSPDVATPQTVKLAMWVYAFPSAVMGLKLGTFVKDMRAAQDLLDWPDDPGPKRGQYRALAEIAALAIRRRISLQKASTNDIEWDGEGL